jgi:hypothetical protein
VADGKDEAMTEFSDGMTRGSGTAPILGALGMVGLAAVALARRRSSPNGRRRPRSDKQAAWIDYLRDHMAGANAAIQVVDRMREAYRGQREGLLFASLYEQFQDDRAVVVELLAALRASRTPSVKRMAGHATGALLEKIAGGRRGDLSLFRTLEALAIGVQGKRCLWRAAQVVAGPLRPAGRRTFIELEADAVNQWEAIEQLRRSLAPHTFVAASNAYSRA